MKYEAQAFSPTKESLEVIEDCKKELFPENQSISDWHNLYMSDHKVRIALDLDITKNEVERNSDILEIGSIPLLFTAALSKIHYKVTGCDIEPDRYATTIDKIGIKVVKCDIELEKLPFEDSSFDAIVFNELFEHLRINPIFTLSEVLRTMKPGAILMLSSPNLRSLMGLFNILIKNKSYSCSGNIYAEYKKLEKLGHMGHVREYTTKEIIDFLNNIGFEVCKVIYRGTYNSNLRQSIIKIMPGLRPFVSYIAKKPK